jgi:hypothetical protein
VEDYIERLSGYIEQEGKDKYVSHYAVILNWKRKDDKENQGKPKPQTLEYL